MVEELPRCIARLSEGDRPRYFTVLFEVVKRQPGMALLLAQETVGLMEVLEDGPLIRFLLEAISIHAINPQKAKRFLKRESQSGQESQHTLRGGVPLSKVQSVLTLYARGHCGKSVQIRSGGGNSFTDGKHIYLPDEIHLGLGEEFDRLAYRVLTARNVGYLEFGSLDLVLEDIVGNWCAPRAEELPIERFFRSFPNTRLAKDLFLIFENKRIETRICLEYPGIERAMKNLGEKWRPERATRPSLQPVEELVEALYRESMHGEEIEIKHSKVERPFLILKGLLDFSDSASVHDSIRATQNAFKLAYELMRQSQDIRRTGETEIDAYSGIESNPFEAKLTVSAMEKGDRKRELEVQRILQNLRDSQEEATLNDARKITSEEYFAQAEFLERVASPSGPLRNAEEDSKNDNPSRKSTLTEGVESIFDSVTYQEWDMTIEDFKPDWAQVVECRLSLGSESIVAKIQEDYGAEIKQLRRFFESLRPDESRRTYGLEEGDELDMDRVIQSRVARRQGLQPSTRIYSQHRRQIRDTAVAFLLDMSSSTNELANKDGKRILDVEKEALTIMAEAIDALGDSFAVYGYSGYSRSQVAFYIAKDFNEPWNKEAQRRVGQMSWMMENRDGAAIRHCTAKLNQHPARNRLLILLSDGKPLDCGCDEYSDNYAQADTRAAILEAKQKGVRSFCITVDPYGQKYLANMYGPNGYTVIDNVNTLPMRLPVIYRRLTG